MVTDHQVMAGMFLNNFKDRMGHSEGIDMQFDLSRLLVRTEGLEELTLPFEKSEMDAVIKATSWRARAIARLEMRLFE
jgi:hypothetical protein